MTHVAVGAERIDITPDEPVPLCGYPTNIESPAFRDGPRPERSEGVHDPIYVSTVAISDGDRTVGVVASDLLNVYHEFCEDVRSRIGDRGVDYDEIVFTATHTHSAPYMPGTTLRINPFLAYESEGATDHVGAIEDAFVECLEAAHGDLSSAEMRHGTARNEQAVVNRREGEKIVDPELSAVVFERDDSGPVVLLNYACHPICFSANTAVVSSDYVSVVYEHLADELDDPTTLFVNGAAGDINPPDVETRNDDEAEYVTDIGIDVASTALEAVENARNSDPRESDGLTVDRRDLDLPIRPLPSREELRDRYDELTDEIDTAEETGDAETVFERRWDRIYTQELLNIHDLDADTLPATMHYAEIGGIGLVSFPGEAFVKHGLDMKDAADADHLVFAGFANEYVGYLPTIAEMEAGGYEVRTCKLDVEAIEQVRSAGFDLVDRE